MQSLWLSLPIISTMPIWQNWHAETHTTQTTTFRFGMTRNALLLLAICTLASGAGCHAIDFYTPSLQQPVPSRLEPPRELSMVSLPLYQIEPPDMVRIEVVNPVPRPSYRIGPLDVLQIKVLGALRQEPIMGFFHVENDGTVNLGVSYGVMRVEGLTIEEARTEITRYLQTFLKAPSVSVQLSRSNAADRITGRYPVGPDGKVNLGEFGMVFLSGKTVTEAREAIGEHLQQYFDAPEVGVEVMEYNSKYYYVISESFINRANMWRFPITGNETVLDAMGHVEAFSNIPGCTIWVARPAPGDFGRDQVLPVNWAAVAHGGVTDTNYQIMPGDRVYIVDDRMVIINNFVTKLTDPIQRLLGVESLGLDTTRSMETLGRDFNRLRQGN
jgi:polysaccharide biosynthesis/export protein